MQTVGSEPRIPSFGVLLHLGLPSPCSSVTCVWGRHAGLCDGHTPTSFVITWPGDMGKLLTAHLSPCCLYEASLHQLGVCPVSGDGDGDVDTRSSDHYFGGGGTNNNICTVRCGATGRTVAAPYLSTSTLAGLL